MVDVFPELLGAVQDMRCVREQCGRATSTELQSVLVDCVSSAVEPCLGDIRIATGSERYACEVLSEYSEAVIPRVGPV